MGPGRTAMIVEMRGKSKGACETALNGILKKKGGLKERGLLNMFDKKGLIVVKKPENVIDGLG